MPAGTNRPTVLSLDGLQPLSIRAKALVFHDPASLRVLDYVERIAASEAPVLVYGETGTGKELIARHIHHLSGRKGPFLAVNCGAINDHLSESELFGHEAGAFTGAAGQHRGWFEAADEGTLFLDEIGDLPLNLQVKLLRVIQEREVVRIGSTKTIPINVRLLAGTNVDLGNAVEAGHFRRDLLYRINIAQVTLPPLRDRPGDILPLAEHFLGVYSKRMNREPSVLTPEAASRLLAYSWPGNIRELENVIHFALLVAPGQDIKPEHLKVTGGWHSQTAPEGTLTGPPSVTSGAAYGANQGTAHGAAHGTTHNPTNGVPHRALNGAHPGNSAAYLGGDESFAVIADQLRKLYGRPEAVSFDELEKIIISEAFNFCHANQVQTASLLGVTRNVVRTLLKRHQLI